MILQAGTLRAHLGGGYGPNLEIVWTHEDLSKTLSHISNVPFVKILGLVRWVTGTGIQRCVDQALQAFCLLFFGQNGDIVLERIRYPLALVADVRDPLVRVPVGGLWQGLVDAVVEILVVREDDVTSNIEQLSVPTMSDPMELAVLKQQRVC